MVRRNAENLDLFETAKEASVYKSVSSVELKSSAQVGKECNEPSGEQNNSFDKLGWLLAHIDGMCPGGKRASSQCYRPEWQ